MKTKQISGQSVTVHNYNTVVVGAGAAGMNCAVHLYEFMQQKGVADPQERIVVVTAGIGLGASRMSGSDKQTYYKMGTSPDVSDSAEEFAKSLTAAGCCHGDLALAEAIGSLREFYHLVQAGVPFPHDPMGTYIGYKTDHDPYERATSAGPKTSRFMSKCLQAKTDRYGIKIHDNQELAKLLTMGQDENKKIVGIVTIDKGSLTESDYAINVYYCENLVLAAGGPGELYETSVYPKGQLGIHGIALKAGLAAENLTESQFGLASIKFRWNVSGTYMQVIPRIFSTDVDGGNEREFLADFFPTMSKMATDIFLKGYQWPFDPQRIENLQSSLIDVLVFNETQKGRRVFMDFLKNPVGNDKMQEFDIEGLEPEARSYLDDTGALQALPIERLEHMNPLAIDIYTENGIDLHSEPLEIAVCAQHNNGGFAIDKWWQSNIAGTFVIGEMAGSHGVKRPGGSALNAGQTGGLRAAEFIVNARSCEVAGSIGNCSELEEQLSWFIEGLADLKNPQAYQTPAEAIKEIQHRMTVSGGHIRKLSDARKALGEAVELYGRIQSEGLKIETTYGLVTAVQVRHLALTSVASLKGIVELLEAGSGSRGSHLVLVDDGVEIHPDVIDKSTRRPLRFKAENESLRGSVLRIRYDGKSPDLFGCESVDVRPAPTDRKAFEPGWADYRDGKIYCD